MDFWPKCFYKLLVRYHALLMFGIYTFRSNPVHSIRPVSSTPASIYIILLLFFCETLSNPWLYFLFIGFVCPFFFCDAGQSHQGFQLVGYLAIVLGALFWWFGITYFVNKVRTCFNLRHLDFEPWFGIVVMLDFSRRFHLYYFRKRCTDKETYLDVSMLNLIFNY